MGDTEGLNKNERKMNEMRWTEIEDGGKKQREREEAERREK